MNVCLSCQQPITNPLCPECLAEEMQDWIKDYKDQALNTFTIHYVPSHGGVTCIKCGRKFSLCPHCYSKDIALEVFNTTPELITSFLDTFNFEMR